MTQPLRLGFSTHLAAFLSGAVLPLSFAPLTWWPVAIVSIAVLYSVLRSVIRDGSSRQLLSLCWLFGLGLYGTGASWIYVSIHQYGQAPAALAVTLTLVFAMGLAAVFALPFVLLAHLKQQKPLMEALVFATVWVLGEWFRGWFLTGFPWLYLGYSFIDTWLAGWAPLVGVLGLSGMIVAGGVVLSQVFFSPSSRNPIWIPVLTIALLGLFIVIGSALQKQTWTLPAAEKPLNVALIQPNHPVITKWQDSEIPKILADMRGRTVNLAEQDLIIWPESAIPVLQSSIPEFLADLNELANDHQTALIAGIPAYSDNKYFNSVIGLGTASGTYQKRRLVPFGEYVPLEQWLRGAIAFFDLPMSSFSAGEERQTLINVGPYQLATAICYEIAYSEPLARDAQLAHLLLTVSNDTWFGDSLGPHQHLQIARLRALETGKPLLRATNDGITAIIDSRGQVVKQLPRFAEGVLLGQIMPHQGSTPYSRWGVLPVLSFCLILLMLAMILPLRKSN